MTAEVNSGLTYAITNVKAGTVVDPLRGGQQQRCVHYHTRVIPPLFLLNETNALVIGLASEWRLEPAVDYDLDRECVEFRVESDGELPCHHRHCGGWHTALRLRGTFRLGHLARR